MPETASLQAEFILRELSESKQRAGPLSGITKIEKNMQNRFPRQRRWRAVRPNGGQGPSREGYNDGNKQCGPSKSMGTGHNLGKI